MTASGAATEPVGSASGLAWVAAGILGGALAGAVDATSSIVGGIGGLSAGKAIRLIALGASLVAAAGGLVGALAALGGWLSRRTAVPERTAALLAALAAGPLVVYDAFALFTGHRAASVPGHQAISMALAAAALGAVGWVAGRYAHRLHAGAAEGTPRSGPVALSLLLLLMGLGCQLANRLVLPRLYQWFHLTLAASTLLSFVLAARLRARGTRGSRVALLVVAVAAGCLASVAALGASQGLRYAAYERTAVTAFALRALPTPGAAHGVATGGERAGGVALPPLPAGPRRPEADVLLITVDALRADHVGAYGYARATTPNIDRLAAEGTRFTRVYSQAPHTSFSVSSLLTSKYFPTMARLAPGERHDTIAAVLRNYGWKTAAFYPPAVFYIDSDKLKTFAETNFDVEYVKFEFIDAQRRVDQLLAYYDQVKPKRSFVWVHFFEPHEPYVAHPGFQFGAGDPSDIDRYDSEIAYTDAAVGRLVREVRARRPGTIVIVAADHGEEFEEHGGRYHGSSLYEEQLRIPLIISIPGVPPHVIEGQVELFDVTPTVLGLLDISVPVRMRGTDLGPWLATPPAPAARLPPAFAELEDKRMVSLGGEKLICDMRLGACAYYDLGADPHERNNLAEERPARVAYLHGLLDNWLDAHLKFEPSPASGSTAAGAPVPKAIERGRLGDLGAAPELAALLTGGAPLAQRREAAALLVGLPPQPPTAQALARTADDPDGPLADWASVGSLRLGAESRHARVAALAADPRTEPALRVRAALALATAGDAGGLPVLAEALDRRDDILLCRLIIVTLGKLGDRRAGPILLQHLSEVQNRREMVEVLGELGDPAAIGPLIERLQHDAYVPVRAEAARSLARIAGRSVAAGGDRRVVAALAEAARHDTEPMVTAAAREASAALQGKAR
jgi:arylsulfatase A-like enzyme/HEAT repeat protein